MNYERTETKIEIAPLGVPMSAANQDSSSIGYLTGDLSQLWEYVHACKT